MKRIPILFMLLLPFLAKAQKPFQVALESRSGFEYNVFNANKSRIIISEEGDTSSALQSVFFQHINLQASWKKKIKAHQFSVKSKIGFDYFPVLAAANLFRPDLAFGYSYKFNKKQSLFFKSKYQGYQTNRIPDETNVLLPPQAYQRWQADLGFKFQAMKYNKSQFKISAFRKQYTPDDSKLWYDAFTLSFQSKQRFRKKGKPSRYLTLNLNFSKRNYVDEPTDFEGTEEEFEEEIKYRTWQYHTAKIEYSFAKTKILTWKTGISFQQRLDILDERFGYRQWQPFIKLDLEKERLNLALKVEGIFRSFTHLKADKASETLLKEGGINKCPILLT